MSDSKLIETWLNVADRVTAEAYTPISFELLPARVRGDTSMWAERFFTPEANPHLQPRPPRFGFHLATDTTPDLLRYRYKVRTYELDVVESINFTLIRIEGHPAILDADPSLRPDLVRAAITTVLNVKGADHQWTFGLPVRLVEGSAFATDPRIDPLFLPSWTSRADGGIRHGVIYLLCYKKFFEMADFRDIRDWFDAAFRQRH